MQHYISLETRFCPFLLNVVLYLIGNGQRNFNKSVAQSLKLATIITEENPSDFYDSMVTNLIVC